MDSSSSAIWRGEVTQTLRDHQKQLDYHSRLIEHQDSTINELRDHSIAVRVKLGLFAGVGAVLGSGIGGAIIVAILHH